MAVITIRIATNEMSIDTMNKMTEDVGNLLRSYSCTVKAIIAVDSIELFNKENEK